MRGEQELTCTYLETNFEFENPNNVVIIGEATGEVNGEHRRFQIKGPIDGGDPEEGQTYVMWGRWRPYRGEDQFNFSSMVRLEPIRKDGAVPYLMRCPGIGKVWANKVWDHYLTNSVQMLREEPRQVAKDLGMKIEVAMQASGWLELNKATERATVKMIGLFGNLGFPKRIAKEVIETWGIKGPDLIERNPYLLMKFKGAGFLRCDELWMRLGLPAKRLKRQTMCMWQYILTEGDGSIWFDTEPLFNAIAEKIGMEGTNPRKALNLGTKSGLLRRVWADEETGAPADDGEIPYVAAATAAKTEDNIVTYVIEALTEEK